jgi:hypothetical protein
MKNEIFGMQCRKQDRYPKENPYNEYGNSLLPSEDPLTGCHLNKIKMRKTNKIQRKRTNKMRKIFTASQ